MSRPHPRPTVTLPAESSLIYCFADRFLAVPGHLDAAQAVPTSDGRVRRHDLAETLWTAALSGLMPRGRVTVTEVENGSSSSRRARPWSTSRPG